MTDTHITTVVGVSHNNGSPHVQNNQRGLWLTQLSIADCCSVLLDISSLSTPKLMQCMSSLLALSIYIQNAMGALFFQARKVAESIPVCLS